MGSINALLSYFTKEYKQNKLLSLKERKKLKSSFYLNELRLINLA